MSVDVSAIVITHNRVKRCIDSVWHNALALQGVRAEMIVVNNGHEPVNLPASLSGTPCFVIPLKENLGAAARNIGLQAASGRFILVLDDDAYIDPGLVEAMLDTFRRDPQIGAVAFRILNGRKEEACLLPTVFHGCACGFRRSALERVGAYPQDYLYYGEEYDLAFRLYQVGYRIVFCPHPRGVRHERDGGGRSHDRILRMLVRNNTYLWFAFLPWRHIASACADTFHRYTCVARKERAEKGFRRGLLDIPWSAIRGLAHRRAMSRDIFRRVALADQVDRAAAQIVARARRRVIVCGVGKFPSFWVRLLRQRGLQVIAFWDGNPCWRDQWISNVPVIVTGAELPYAPADCGWLVGTASLADNAIWSERLMWELGLTRFDPPRDPAQPATTTAYGTIDLAETAGVRVFFPENTRNPAPKPNGIFPACNHGVRKDAVQREERL